MAATAYASLVSLLNTLDQIHAHPLVSTFFDMYQNNSLSKEVNFFVDFVEKYFSADSKEVEDLVRRIANAAHEAENIIEVHAADRINGGRSPTFFPNLERIIQKMESIKNEVIKVKAEIGKSRSSLPDLRPSSSSSSSTPPANVEGTNMVGFEYYVDQLFDDLTGYHVGHKIISITGMGGIGKTTLARNLYENSHVRCYFNVRAWVTVSQESSARKVYLQALSSLGVAIDEDSMDDRQLSLEVHRTLFNRRYLIVLDDLWSVDIWDNIKFFFPENENGSRIIVTTRELKLANSIGSSSLAIKFLDEKNSWKLFCNKIFPLQSFPPELEEVGKKIAKKCGGLPLGITVIGGLLGKSPKTQEYWEKIAKDKSLILNLGENNPLSILYLSYKYLPICLKPCFLHFGMYPEDYNIDVSDVIKLWIAEGFIKANKGKNLEEVAESYLNDLVDRNLLLLDFSIPSGKSCSTHDLVRDLCIKIGEKENFFCVQRSIDGNRHFIADEITTRFYSQESHASKTPSIPYPLIVPSKRAAPFKTRLLRVFYCNNPIPYYPLQEVNMHFVRDNSYYVHDYFLPSSVSRFWRLQTIIVRTSKEFVAPAAIWKMPQLRHIDILLICLPPPSDDDVYVLRNLQIGM